MATEAAAYVLVAGLAFLAGSVWHNRYTGWKPEARRNNLTDYLRWCAGLKAGLAAEKERAGRVSAVRQNPAAAVNSFPASLTALDASLGKSRPVAVPEEAASAQLL
jgi:hypothetical protein